jgi:predicted acylesterase/phospholipase RssA
MISAESIKYLCFGVGGVNGWTYVGVLEALEQELNESNLVLYSQLKGVCGSSAGSIIATGIMLQYNTIELRELFITMTEHFSKNTVGKMRVLNVFDQKGIFDTTAISDMIQKMITTKLGPDKRDITLGALFERTHKVLALGAYNLTLERSEVLDHQSMPNLPLWKAVCMSCAIPLIFYPVEHNNNMYVDAGICEPVPYRIFPLHESLVCYIQGNHGFVAAREMGVMDYICRISHGFEKATHWQIELLAPEFKMRFLKLCIPCCSANTEEGFRMDESTREHLIQIGKTTTLSRFHYKTALLTQAVLVNAHINKFRQARLQNSN